jgi:hypothetical protein
METPTPRTDAFIGNQDGTYMTEGEIAMCNFARELERELIAANAQIVALRGAIEGIECDARDLRKFKKFPESVESIACSIILKLKEVAQ